MAQDVWVTAHTWDARDYAERCKLEKMSKKRNIVKVYPDEEYSVFRDGVGQVPKPFAFGPNETKTVEVELDFASPDRPRDWSLVAWGSQGPVYVYHNNGKQSESLYASPGAR